jgi:hypothetical protein
MNRKLTGSVGLCMVGAVVSAAAIGITVQDKGGKAAWICLVVAIYVVGMVIASAANAILERKQ